MSGIMRTKCLAMILFVSCQARRPNMLVCLLLSLLVMSSISIDDKWFIIEVQGWRMKQVKIQKDNVLIVDKNGYSTENKKDGLGEISGGSDFSPIKAEAGKAFPGCYRKFWKSDTEFRQDYNAETEYGQDYFSFETLDYIEDVSQHKSPSSHLKEDRKEVVFLSRIPETLSLSPTNLYAGNYITRCDGEQETKRKRSNL